MSANHFPAGGLARDGDPLLLTPERAGWTWCGLHVVALEPGRPRRLSTGEAEVIVLPLSATGVTVRASGAGAHPTEARPDEPDGPRASGPTSAGRGAGAATEPVELHLDGRTSVFARVTDFAYVGRDTNLELTSASGGEVALASARCEHRLPPAYGPAEAVPVEVRGAGPATRQVTNFASPEVWSHADRLMCVELITPDGNWSSYPPHRHDDSPECPVNNEEIYYFRIGRAGTTEPAAEGFGLHRTYTPDGVVDDNIVVADGDVYVVPRGYHGPCVAAPGYTMYYLNVLAGPSGERSMAFCDDPTHHWVRDSWEGMPTDPRCPVTSHLGLRSQPGR